MDGCCVQAQEEVAKEAAAAQEVAQEPAPTGHAPEVMTLE